MKIRMFAILALVLGMAVNAKADIQDRIDNCQSRGGGTCIFDLLRELAAQNNGGGHKPESLNLGTYRLLGGNCKPVAQVLESTDSSLTINWGTGLATYNCSTGTCNNSSNSERVKINSRQAFSVSGPNYVCSFAF